MDDKHAKIQAQLDAVRISYIASLRDKQEAVYTHWNKLKTGWCAEAFDQLYMVIHGLAGSAETFGFPQITKQARLVVNYFKSLNPHAAPVAADYVTEIDQEVLKLLELLQHIRKS